MRIENQAVLGILFDLWRKRFGSAYHFFKNLSTSSAHTAYPLSLRCTPSSRRHSLFALSAESIKSPYTSRYSAPNSFASWCKCRLMSFIKLLLIHSKRIGNTLCTTIVEFLNHD